MSGFERDSSADEKSAAAGMGKDGAEEAGGAARPEEDEADFVVAEDIAAEYEVGEVDDAHDMVDDGEGNGDEVDEEEEDAAAVVEDMSRATFKGHSDAVYCVAVNPKAPSQFVSGGGDDKGFLWTIADNGTVAKASELGGHTDTVASASFSADGALLATGCYGGIVKVWEAATGGSKHLLEGPDDVECLAWHTTGSVLLTGSQDGTVWMWDASAGTCMQVFAGHESKVSCVMFTSSGKAVVTGSDDATVRVWAPRTGECRHTFGGHGFHEGTVTCLARHPDSAQAPLIMSGGEDGTARVMHVQNKRVLGTLVHCAAGEGSVEAVGFCATHPWVATAGTDGALKVWDSISGTCRHACVHPGAVTRLEWHPAAPVAFTACADGNLRTWDGRTGECWRVLTGHTDMILDLRLIDLRSLEDSAAVAATPTLAGGAEFPVLIVTASDDKTCKVFRWPAEA